MTWTDANGVKHISDTDETNPEGDAHLLECELCATNYPVSAYMARQAHNKGEGA